MRRLALFCGGFAAGIFLAQYLLPGGWLLSGGLVCLALGFGALLLPECWRKRAILCLVGAALALAASNGLAFLYRSITGQMYYRTVASYPKTISGFLLAFAVTAIGTLLWQHFFIKFALVGVILFIYCTLYRAQLARLWSMGLGILRGIFHRK